MKNALYDILTPCTKCYPRYYHSAMGAPLISPTLRIHKEGDEHGMTACGYNAANPGWYWETKAWSKRVVKLEADLKWEQARVDELSSEPIGEFDLLLMFYNDIVRWSEKPRRSREVQRLVREYGDRLDSVTPL